MNWGKWRKRFFDWTDPSRDLWLWILAGLFVGSMTGYMLGLL